MKKIIDNLKFDKAINYIKDIFLYHSEHTKKIYSCKLLNGYKFMPDGAIELTIKQFGRGNFIIIEAAELFHNEQLMHALSPYDVAKVTFIALGNILSRFPDSQKEEVFKKILAEIMEE
jgi:hypothetical protein